MKHARSLRSALLRVLGLFRGDRQNLEFADELQSHLQFQIETNIQADMMAGEARRSALTVSGGHAGRRGLPSPAVPSFRGDDDARRSICVSNAAEVVGLRAE